MIDLEKPGLALVIQEDVKTQYLEAERVLDVGRLGCSIHMIDEVYAAEDRLDAYLFDLLPNLLRSRQISTVILHLVNQVKHTLKTTFVPDVVFACIHVPDVVLAGFVDCIVRQMHAHIVQVVFVWTLVLFSGKPGHSTFVDEAPQWTNACDQHVDAQVKLEFVDEEGLVDVLLGYVVFSLHYPVGAPGQKDPVALALLFWFDDECFWLLAFKQVAELLQVFGQHEGCWEEIEMLWARSLHSPEVDCQVVLPCQHLHLW
jgi:hypothetical protein